MKKIKRPGCLFAALAVAGVCLWMVLTIASLTYLAYGNMTLEPAIIRYMDEHDGRWPSSWDDLEPYYKDLYLRVHTTRFIRKYWTVAWDVDPYVVFDQTKGLPDDNFHSTKDDFCSIVYRHSLEPPGGGDRLWVLTPRIRDYIRKRKGLPDPELR